MEKTPMRTLVRLSLIPALLVCVSLPLGAQTRTGVAGDLTKDLADVEKKIVGLAKALPESAWKYTPGPGARSTGEVFMHVAADNYFMPAAMGVSTPAETGITKEYKTAAAWEKKALNRDQTIAELEKSFAFLKKALADVPDAKFEAPLEVFGDKTTSRGVWIMTVTHLHEHLGQLIAYARGNKVTPPWSK
jgi:uncharacterized damage-inducible protein DinB